MEINRPLNRQGVVYFTFFNQNRPFAGIDQSATLQYAANLKGETCPNGLLHGLGRCIQLVAIHQISLVIDLTARDLQAYQKAKGLPWEIAKAFDNSAVIGQFLPFGESYKNGINFSLTQNGEIKQKGNTSDMLYSFEKIICYISQFFTLQQGDLIYTGTPAGVGPVKIGDRLQGYVDDKCMFDVEIK